MGLYALIGIPLLFLVGIGMTLLGQPGGWIPIIIALLLTIVWICVVVLPHKEGIDK